MRSQGIDVDEYDPLLNRWARIGLPNGQVGRSLWKESLIPQMQLRTARNIKVIHPFLSMALQEVCSSTDIFVSFVKAILFLMGKYNTTLIFLFKTVPCR